MADQRYTDMSPGDMVQACGNDSMKWAEAFCERFPAVPLDEAYGWFANAMMTMWDVTNSEATHDDCALVEHISALVRNRDLWRDLGDKAFHIARSAFTAQEHDAKCSRPQEEVGFGMAGGGYGAYGYCPECGAMLWKSEEPDDA